MVNEYGKCLVYQEIKQLFDAGKIIGPSDDNLIQPASYEPPIGNFLYALDDRKGIFRPRRGENIERTLLRTMPSTYRSRHDLTEDGFVLRVGHAYLMPLDARLILEQGEKVTSWPKSSIGRVFLNCSMLADRNQNRDEAHYQFGTGVETGLWLMVEPKAFDVVVYPGMTLTQLRFLTDDGGQLRGNQLRELHARTPLLYRMGEDGVKRAIAHPLVDSYGLSVHVDLEGGDTEGVVGFRAINSPLPMDLARRDLPLERYFEPLVAKDGQLTVRPGDKMLLACKELLQLPTDVSMELIQHARTGLKGEWHLAGFVDPNFGMGEAEGPSSLVLELVSQEEKKVRLRDGDQVSSLVVYHTTPTEKPYGSAGNNYQGQAGPRPPKFVTRPDYLKLGDFARLEEEVLCEEIGTVMSVRGSKTGFEFLNGRSRARLDDIVDHAFPHKRRHCEGDPLTPQLVSYGVILGKGHSVFLYERASDPKNLGEKRLSGRLSVGAGGHIRPGDGPEYIVSAAVRKISKELLIEGGIPDYSVIGTLVADEEAVDRDHFGIVLVGYAGGDVRAHGESIHSGRMVPIDEVQRLLEDHPERFETWSRALIPNLEAIHRMTLAERRERAAGK